MSRPGTRHYDCVRRAWHSDRHHPIRGSLIQEIFRIVNEFHSLSTRRNREWQETLPIVVLKVEEIMYSKANSEAEYSDLKTLWDRVNDAINTIIRRDQSSESGKLLQPCIEAALQLGCTPRRSSRSQQNDPQRYYLRPETPEATSVPPGNSRTTIHGNHSPLMPMNSLHSFLKSDSHSIQNINYNVKKFPLLLKNFASRDYHNASWLVYPLCYTDQIQPENTEFCSTKLMESDELGVPRNLSTDKLDGSEFISPSDLEQSSDKGHELKCDLTLRLGSCASLENCWPLEVENGNSNTRGQTRTFKNCLNK